MSFKKLFLALGIVAISCSKFEPVEVTEKYYINAECVETESSKTEMRGLEVYWSSCDTIGLTTGKNLKKAITKTESPSKNATFEVASKATGVWYAFHPYMELSKTKTDTSVIAYIKETQYPSLTSFDGRSDVMLSKPIDFGESGSRSVNAEFNRLCGVVKIVYTDNTATNDFSQDGDYVISVSMKNGKYPLCGRSKIDLSKQSYKDNGHQTTKTEVIASYDADDNFVIDGNNAAYICVVPWEINSGYTIFTLKMNSGKTFERKITSYKSLEGGHILLEANKVTTFKISITD